MSKTYSNRQISTLCFLIVLLTLALVYQAYGHAKKTQWLNYNVPIFILMGVDQETVRDGIKKGALETVKTKDPSRNTIMFGF